MEATGIWLLSKSFDNSASWQKELRSSKSGFICGFQFCPPPPETGYVRGLRYSGGHGWSYSSSSGAREAQRWRKVRFCVVTVCSGPS